MFVLVVGISSSGAKWKPKYTIPKNALTCDVCKALITGIGEYLKIHLFIIVKFNPKLSRKSMRLDNHYFQALVPSPVPLDPIQILNQKSNWDWGDTKITRLLWTLAPTL